MRRYLALFAIPLAACADNAPGTSALVRDSAVVRIVENSAPLWQPGDQWHLSGNPTVDIGAVDGDADQQLFQVMDAARLPDGRIVISSRGTKVPSARNPPSVASRWRCGCQFAREPWVWIEATRPTERSGSPTVARMNDVTVRAATRARSPSRARWYRK